MIAMKMGGFGSPFELVKVMDSEGQGREMRDEVKRDAIGLMERGNDVSCLCVVLHVCIGGGKKFGFRFLKDHLGCLGGHRYME